MTDRPALCQEIGCPHGSWGMVVACPHCGTPRHVSPSALAAERPDPDFAFGPTTYEDIRRVIHTALDRDGQHDWDETDRLTEVLAPTVWNEIITFPPSAATERTEPLDDELAVAVLVAHQRRDAESCLCGWNKWGASHAEHVWRMLTLARLSPPAATQEGE